MKRLLIASLTLVMISSAAIAATTTTKSTTTQTTYTEQFIQKHTQKITDAEKNCKKDKKQMKMLGLKSRNK